MKTPYFLIHKDILDSNINNFKEAFSFFWKNAILGYSVKTNSLPWLLKYMKKNDAYAEVVSDEEYKLAKLCGFKDEMIIFNGPIKSSEQISKAIKNGAIVNLDSKRDIDFVMNNQINDIKKIGIRVNVNPNVFNPNDIGYTEDGFRFGFSYENGELEKVISLLRNRFGKDIEFGIHMHCNTITRSLESYGAIANYTKQIIGTYDLKLSFIDIGGGFFGGVEGKPKAIDYIKVIKQNLEGAIDFNTCKLIVEPGSAIIGSAVDLYTSVVDVKDTDYSRIVTTDGSRIHIDPLWAKKKYMYSLNAKSSNRFNKQIICGYTCMDHDRLMTLENEFELHIDDKVIYHRVGAYSITFGGPFIRYFPDVYVTNGDSFNLVRKRIEIDDYYHIHTNCNLGDE